jgi:hypothetical protein
VVVSQSDRGEHLDETFEMDRESIPTGELPALPPTTSSVKPRIRPIRFGIRMLLFALVMYFAIGLLPDLFNAADELRRLNPLLIGLGFGLQLLALFFYSLLTKAALGEAGEQLSSLRMFRIQLSTRALTNVVPGGNAAGSASSRCPGSRVQTPGSPWRPPASARPWF